MGSLTSSLIISLIDKVSGPAKGVATALKGLAAAEKSLATSSNLKGVDNLTKSLKNAAGAAKSFGTASAGWSSGFSKEISKLNLTQQQIDRLRASFERFQNTLKAGGVRKVSDFLPRLDGWERQTIGSLQRAERAYSHFQRRTSRMADIRHAANHAIYHVAGGYAVVRGAEKAVEATAELGREKVREDLSGMTPNERVSALAQARDLSHRFNSVNQVDVVSHLRKLRGTLGDLHHAQEMVEDVVKSQVVLSSGPGGAEGAVRDLDQITKGLEGAGYASSPEKFRSMLTAFVKAKNLFGETLTGEDFRTFIQRSKTSKFGLSEAYLAGVVPTMIQHEGANQFGTAQATAFNSLVGGRQTKGAKAKLRSFGLLGKDDKLVDQALFTSDPFAWTMKHILPRAEKAGMSLDANSTPEQKDKFVDFLMQGFSHRNAGEFFASLIANRAVIEKDRANLATAKGPEAAQDVIKNDPFQAWNAFKSQTTNLVQNMLESSSLIQSGLSTIADAIGGWAKKFSELGDGTKKVIANTVEGTAIGGGLLVAGLLAKKGFDWLRPGGGKAAAGGIDAAIEAAGGAGGKAAGRGGIAKWLARVPWLIPLIASTRPDIMTDPVLLDDLRKRKREGRIAPGSTGNGYNRDYTLGYEGGFSKSPSIIPPGGFKTMTGYNASHVAPGELSGQLDQSATASAAGTKTGESFSSSLDAELSKAKEKARAAAQEIINILSFSVSPTVSPKINLPAATPGKQSSADSLKQNRHAAFADGINFGSFA